MASPPIWSNNWTVISNDIKKFTLTFESTCNPGGASGIGEETARVFALRGAHVIIAARNMAAANDVQQHILQCTPMAKVDVLKLDLSSLKSVRAFADKFLSLDLPLNILM